MGTVALTIFGGVLVYVLGKIIERTVIEPLNDYRRLVMEIAGALPMHANFWGDTYMREMIAASVGPYGTEESYGIELSRATGEAARELRAKAAQLAAYAVTLPCYRLWSTLHLMPNRGDLLLASNELAGIANRLPASNRDDVVENSLANSRIQELLRLARK